MKKFSYLMLAAAMTLGFAACSNQDNTGDNSAVVSDPKDAVIIQEINVGGSKSAETNKNYLFNKGIILYNNSNAATILSNFGIAFTSPLNGEAANKNYDDNGVLVYEKEGYVPALQGVWYYPGSITIAPYTSVVIAINGAIDHTKEVNGDTSFDISNADMACYDPEGAYNNASYYPAPANVPEAKWLKGFRFNTSGNVWPISTLSPAIFIFSAPAKVTLSEYFTDEANRTYTNQTTSAAYLAVKIPRSWIIDGVELFNKAKLENSTKRLPSYIDAGYGLYATTSGYSAYRNVDKAATEAITENSGRLVYDYAGGVDDSTDPSGIDAAASIKNGAKIVFLDTNNSTADFHLRKDWSLK